MSIYFVACDQCLIFKVGYSARGPQNRAIQVSRRHQRLSWDGHRPRFLGYIEGDPADEAELHLRLGHLAIGGEWFFYDERALAWVRFLCALGIVGRYLQAVADTDVDVLDRSAR